VLLDCLKHGTGAAKIQAVLNPYPPVAQDANEKRRKMPFDAFPVRQTDPPRQAVYILQRINPRNNVLIRRKLSLAAKQLHEDIKNTSAEIRFKNRFNLNETGIDRAVLQMWEKKIDDYARKCYEIFCDHWKLRTEKKTSAFVRVALDLLLPLIRGLGQSAEHEAIRRHIARGTIGTSPTESYEASALAICERWKEELDIEAADLDVVAASSKACLERKLVSTGELAESAETLRPSHRLSEVVLQFTRRGKSLLVKPCANMEVAIANTYKVLLSYMAEAKSIVRSTERDITAGELKSNFKNTPFAEALDMDDWNLLIREFRQKRPAGCRNLMIGVLARRTGKSLATVDTYTKPGRKRKKTVR
jgi:hypothetical protein